MYNVTSNVSALLRPIKIIIKLQAVFVIVLILTSSIKPASMRKVSGFPESDVLRIAFYYTIHHFVVQW